MEHEIIEIKNSGVAEDVKKKLFDCAMGSDWEEVVRICKEQPNSHKAIIPASGETILSMAVSEKKEKIVAKLVEQMSGAGLIDALKIGNEGGDTPLHLAALLGNVRMCECIGNKDPKLVGVRNSQGETPLFLAAHRGQEKGFLFLDGLCESHQGYGYCRRNDGWTILHCAIAGEHFDLAILILGLYNDLAHSVDESGISPLHLLARKPTAFRSGTPLRLIEKFVYQSYQPRSRAQHVFWLNYNIFFKLIQFESTAMMVFLGIKMIKEIKAIKEKHLRSIRIMDELLKCDSNYDYYGNGENTPHLHHSNEETIPYNINERSTVEEKSLCKSETPILIAAQNGVIEMMEKILEFFPVAIHDRNSEKKNIELLAVENRQPKVYKLLLNRKFSRESMFLAVDNKGNSELHLAAMLRDDRPWHMPGYAMQMQWEIKWYKFVKSSMPHHFFKHYNDDRLTPKEIFTKDHSDLVNKGGKWLNSTSSSCSVIAALIATGAFATSTSVPGSFNEKNGRPNLAMETAFDIFSVSSLIALCFSVTSLVMFLGILTSRHEEDDFHNKLPRKLLFGLSTLFISIAAMLVSFCAGHSFVLHLKNGDIPLFAAACLPISFSVFTEFPLYVDLMWATFKRIPEPHYKVVF